MLRDIIRRAVEAAFSTRELEEAIANSIAFSIDYDAIAENLLSTIDIDDMVQECAEEYAIDILELP